MTEIEQMIEDCMNRESKMSDWETKFVDSIAGKADRLTQMQLAKLEDIWERIT